MSVLCIWLLAFKAKLAVNDQRITKLWDLLHVFMCAVRGEDSYSLFTRIPGNQGRGAYCSLQRTHVGTSRGLSGPMRHDQNHPPAATRKHGP
jgi:hypothetical protein